MLPLIRTLASKYWGVCIYGEDDSVRVAIDVCDGSEKERVRCCVKPG